MKSQNQISLKILTFALLLIATNEVWAVPNNQIPSSIEIKTNETFEQSNIEAKDIFFDFRYQNNFTYKEYYNPQFTKVLISKDKQVFYPKEIVYYAQTYPMGSVMPVEPHLREIEAYEDPKLTAERKELENAKPKKIQTIQTNGTGGGDWNSTSTWLGGKIPQSGDEVIVAEDDKLVINSDVYVNSLVLKSNAVVRSDSWARRIVINKNLQVSDSATIISNFGSGKLDCYITAANDGKSKISIANSAKVSFENLKILGETFFEKGNMDVMNFSAIKQKDFIKQTGTVLNIGQKK